MAVVAVVGVTALVVFSVLYFGLLLVTPRQSTVRAQVVSAMSQIGLSIRLYGETRGQPPASFGDLLRQGLVGDPAVFEGFVLVGGDEEVLVVQQQPCRAVKRGEPWGGLGETTDVDIPAARAVLLVGQEPVLMDEDEFQKKHSHLLTQ